MTHHKKLIYFIVKSNNIYERTVTMTSQEQQTIFTEIEKYIRDAIANNGGYFNREVILMQSMEWMGKYPVEFNSILNYIENQGKMNMDMDMDDSTPSMALDMDDCTPSVVRNDYPSDMEDDFDYDSNIPLQRTMSSS